MAEGFAENVAPTAAISAITENYPFSIGLLREILQNSDDAKAKKQIFLLDHRIHGSESIYHPHLTQTQGPALLAYNNELIGAEDWEALKNIHRSSKTTDTSKIGKYGIGFRSCYHLTDTPHILSGSHLAILDPQHEFAEFMGVKLGGVKLDFVKDMGKYSDQLSAFARDIFDPSADLAQPFNGAIFRLPLRTSPSQIGNRAISPEEVSDLLRNFALEELNIALLFLRNVTSIEIFEINPDGEKSKVAFATVDRSLVQVHGKYEMHMATVRTHLPTLSEEREWRILHAPFSETEAVNTLSLRLGGNPTTTLSQHKLIPSIGLAKPLNSPEMTKAGRLFTFLPLPLRTGFPIHINALFSLNRSRQNLRNGGEIGIVKQSDDHALIEWNKMLFEIFVPEAWAALLEVLVQHDQVTGIFDAWPVLQADVQSGDYLYWKDMPLDVARYAICLPIWPIFGQDFPSYDHLESLLVAETVTADEVLNALVRANLAITQPPQHITQILLNNFESSIQLLSPEIVHEKLLEATHEVLELDDKTMDIILAYLLSTSDCHFIIGLPLIPSVGGSRVKLEARSSTHSEFHTLLSQTEEGLFEAYDPEAISLQRLHPDVRNVLLSKGLSVLNIRIVDSNRVLTYLQCSPYASQHQGTLKSEEIDWLNRFWVCAQTSCWESALFNQLYLVPTTRGTRCLTESVFYTDAEPDPASLLSTLGICILDPRLELGARGAFKKLSHCSNVRDILLALPPCIHAQFGEEQAGKLCDFFIKHLPASSFFSQNGTSSLRSRLRSIPMFPVLSPSPAKPSTTRTSIAPTLAVRGVDPNSIPVLPQGIPIAWVDLRMISQDILRYLDSDCPFPFSSNDMQDLMLEQFQSQSLDTQLVFIQYLVSNPLSVSLGTLTRLAEIEFVLTSDGRRRAPKDVIDPAAQIARLYPGASSHLPDVSQPVLETLVNHLRSLNLFVTDLSLSILRDRIGFISDGHTSELELATNLINFVSQGRFDCHNLFDSGISRELRWIPTSKGLQSPLTCRDTLSHGGRTYLFDEVMPMVDADVHIGHSLRRTFLWDTEVPFKVVLLQLTKVLDNPEPRFGKVRSIIQYLGCRNLARSEHYSLRSLLQGRKWVPTREQTLVDVVDAVLGKEGVPEVGFYSVGFDAYMHDFLRSMGCVDLPSKATISSRLRSLYFSSLAKKPASHKVALGVIRLLYWLPPLLSEEHTNLIIPDIKGVLRPFNSVCYNDLGARACMADLGGKYLAHSNISESLANELGLKRLGLIDAGNQSDDSLDMGEDLITTIHNRLREYTDSQLLLEFLANASDAGATEFNVLVDERSSPDRYLISSHCGSFQSAPALVVHNNGVFTEEDFKGILRTGIGGKTGRQDTIGQFGLGALTMFHITEFAMIISQDHVLFINPTKAHMPVSRASLRVPLSKVRRFYSDHLIPVLGLFDFNPPADESEEYTYHGTIFRLPARDDCQFLPDVEPIFRRTVQPLNVISTFRNVASKCLLFTQIKTIRCFQRNHRSFSALWSFTAFRNAPSQVSPHLDLRTVTISHDEEWRVLSLRVDETDYPPFISSLRERYRLRLPLVVRVATCSAPSANHNLFSTLPLPIGLDLPVHISGPFILASDRRSIRLDEYGNNEAFYNRWLLRTIIPTLYLHVLADRSSLSDNAVYWPGNSRVAREDKYNVISTIVMDAVHKSAVNTDLPVFKSRFYSQSLLPEEAYFIDLLPVSVLKVLQALKPPDAVELPPSVLRRLQRTENGDDIRLIGPEYIHDLIQSHGTRFSPNSLEFKQLQDLLDFLLSGSSPFDCLNGLPLLPLLDGNFTNFGPAVEGPCFYVLPSAVIEDGVFLSSRIVHRILDVSKFLPIRQLNVVAINKTNIGELINDYISPSQILRDADSTIQQWIKNFWKAFSKLNISPSAISAFPLIPTLTSGLYYSLDYCRASTVIIADFTYAEPFLSKCLTQMGFILIDTASLLTGIRSTLNLSLLTLESLFPKFRTIPGSLSDIFGRLDSDVRPAFNDWVISGLRGKTQSYLKKHSEYLSLPLWKSTDGSFVTALDAWMLPQLVALQTVAPFASPNVVGFDRLLRDMGTRPQSYIRWILDIPTRLAPSLDGAFEKLIPVLLDHTPGNSTIPLPNSQRLIRESNELYSSSDDLFLAAFGSDSDRFILPPFRKFEARLGQFGLIQRRGMSISLFRNCVEAFQNATGPNLRDRAATIYIIFAEDLPLHAGRSTEREWKTLDDLCFIPRNMSPQPLPNIDTTKYIAPHVRALPGIVSPNKLVRVDYMAISWTQRALYYNQPHQRVIMTHPSLSIPTAEEVVNHLVVLARDLARDHPKNSTVCRHLKQTYEWLNKNADSAQIFLRQSAGIPIFLNVDDPKTEAWSWKKAEHILLDDYDTGTLECPRDFLKPFQALLVAAGAATIKYGNEDNIAYELQNDEKRLSSLCANLDRMRKEGVCTDVCFVCDSPDSEPLKAHRTYLAAYSSYFNAMFSGTFVEARDASSQNPIIVPVLGYSRTCVEKVLGFAYTATEPKLTKTDADTDLALEMLTLANVWHMTELHRVLQSVIVRSRMVDPFLLERIRVAAKDAGATELVDYCKTYKKDNLELVNRVAAQAQD